MWDHDDTDDLPIRPRVPVGVPPSDPLEDILDRLAARDRDEIAAIVRREIARPVKVYSKN